MKRDEDNYGYRSFVVNGSADTVARKEMRKLTSKKCNSVLEIVCKLLCRMKVVRSTKAIYSSSWMRLQVTIG